MAPQDPNSVRMSLGDHLEELRRRLILGLIGPVVGAAVALVFGKQLLTLVLTPYVEAQRSAGFATAAEALNVTETFGAYLKVSLLGGLVIGLPWLLWHLWRFIAAGLYVHERRFVIALVPGSALLTVLGLAFMYLIMLPVMLSFFIRFAASMPMPQAGESQWFGWMYDRLKLTELRPPPPENPPVTVTDSPLPRLPVLAEDPTHPPEGAAWIVGQTMKIRVGDRTLRYVPEFVGPVAQRQRLNEWITLVLHLAIAFALAFQTPLVLVLLNRTGLVSLDRLRAFRKYALLVAFVVGAVLTPADPVSQVLLAVPMYALYELGMLLCRAIAQRQAKQSERPA